MISIVASSGRLEAFNAPVSYERVHTATESYETGASRVSTLFAISRIASNDVSFNVQTSL